MGIGKIFTKAAPIMALAAAGLAGCNNADIEFDSDGVPLAELDYSGAAPTGVVLAGPDTVLISNGDEFIIEVEGSNEARDRMRFAMEDGALVIHRENGDWNGGDGEATVNITMPAPETLVMAGSGSITTDAVATRSDIVIAGSGTLRADGVDAESLEVTIAGSGSLRASGVTERLELTVAGSGNAEMAALRVDEAEVNIAGSGDARFASDGRVEANIVGSGTVRVSGSASCEVETVGSGRLICEAAATTRDPEEA